MVAVCFSCRVVFHADVGSCTQKQRQTFLYSMCSFCSFRSLRDLVIHLLGPSISGSLTSLAVIVQKTIRHNHPSASALTCRSQSKITICKYCSTFLMMCYGNYGRTKLIVVIIEFSLSDILGCFFSSQLQSYGAEIKFGKCSTSSSGFQNLEKKNKGLSHLLYLFKSSFLNNVGCKRC